MAKFNTTINNKTTNLAGGKAFKMDTKTELVHAVLTTFLENKFYETGDERLERIKKLVKKNDPVFVAKLAYVARTEFNLRSVSTVLLAELSNNHKGDSLVSKVIEKVVQRVDDITELASYLDGKLTRQVKKGIRHSLYKFNRYQLAKYRGESHKYKLVDIFNLVHPKPQFASEEQKQAWADLIAGKLISTDTWESKISTTTDKKKSWEDLILENKLGYMATLRNLNNFIREKISNEALEKVIQKLTDREEVKKSKQLPFRFMTAYKNVEGNRKLTDAVVRALDLALDNMPTLDGKTLIAIDCSGSMNGDPIEKASIFGAAIAKANPNADIILYDTQVKGFKYTTLSPTIALAEMIQNIQMGGGTETSLVFKYARTFRLKYDRIIIISDQESWVESAWYGGESIKNEYLFYKQLLEVDPYVYAIDIEGYGTKDITGEKVFHLTGWSERLLDFIGKVEQGENLVKYINDLEIF